MTKSERYLLDVNVLIAILDEDHVHHQIAMKWFEELGLQWAVCPLTEAGLLRYMTRRDRGGLTVEEATILLDNLAKIPGYHYQAISDDWRSLTRPFFRRLFGHNQITDAYLLGTAIHDGLVLATFDRGILHLAGEDRRHVHLLEAN